MLRCIIVDDEPLALDLLQDNISRVPYLKLEARCQNAMEAIQVMQQHTIDLVFSDIQMPGLSGLQLIGSLPQKPMFILITAHEKFALEGYALDVVDYLLKPVSYDRFVKACNKALERHSLVQAVQQAGTPIQELASIFLPVDYSLVKVVLNEIMWIEALKDYIKIHFTESNKKSLLVRYSLKNLEEILPVSRFMRIHKSCIVNTTLVTAVRKNSIFLGDKEFPVSESYRYNLKRITG